MDNFISSESGRRTTTLCATVSALIAAALTTTPVMAEERANEPVLEEIVVTAKKRAQNLQDVPIAITALSSETLNNAGIKTTQDLTVAVPGLNVSRQLSTVAPILRGVGTYNVSPGFEGAVAVYVDEVYIPSAHASMFSLANVDRVEVLRGPQGTLFGRNATGGLIHVVTEKPTNEATGSASISYANQDTVEAKLYAAGGLSDGVSADIGVFFREQGDGYGTNLNTGNDALYRDELAAKSKIFFNFDRSELSISADYAESESDFGVNRRPAKGTSTLFGTPPTADFFDVNVSDDHHADNEQWGISAKYTREFNGFDAVALVSHRELDVSLSTDQAEDPIPFISADLTIEGESRTAELRLQSTGDGRLEWVVGGYYFDSEDAVTPVNLSGLGILGATARAPGGPFAAFARYGTQGTTSWALFGEIVWSLDDRTSLSLGARYTEEDKDFDQQTIITAGPGSPFGQGTSFPAPAYQDSKTFTEPSWRISIDRALGEEGNHLIYASFSHGFKSGQYNTFEEGPNAGPVDPELLDAYEIGLKSEFANKRVRLNGAAFLYDYKDLQLSTQIAGVSVIRNAAKAETMGLELEMLAALTDELELNLAAAYVDTEFKSFPTAEITTANPFRGPCPASAPGFPNCSIFGEAAGNQLPRAPEFEISAGITYHGTTDLGDLLIALNVYHNDGSYQDFANRTEIDSYTLINATAALSFGEDDQYTVRLFGQNLGDEKYFTYGTATIFGDLQAAAPGREFGIAFEINW